MTDALVSPVPEPIVGWTTASSRRQPALAETTKLLDDRGLTDLIAEMAHFGRFVAFPVGNEWAAMLARRAEKGRFEPIPGGGDWGAMLADDPAISMALLATIDARACQARLDELINEARHVRDAQASRRAMATLISAILEVALQVDEWLAPLEARRDGAFRPVADAMDRSIRSILAPRLRALLPHADPLLADPDLDGSRDLLQGLHPRWQIAVFDDGTIVAILEPETDQSNWLLEQIAELAERFCEELARVVEISRNAFTDHEKWPDLPAHIALVVAFAKVFRYAQDALNGVPARMISAFFADQIGMTPREAVPDQVVLAAIPKTGKSGLIPAGSVFETGRDGDGQTVRFATDAPVLVTDVRLAALRVVQPSIDESGAVRLASTHLPGASDETNLAPSAIITSPLLALSSGSREFRLTLRTTEPLTITEQHMSAAIRVSIATAQGWVELAAAGVVPVWSVGDDTIALGFTVPADFTAPTGPADGDVPPAGALRLSLDQAPYGIALFDAVTIACAELTLTCDDPAGLAVTTPAGPASSVGAAPFGVPPFCGGWLRIEHPLLDRRCRSVSLTLTWAGLPSGRDGLTGHYRDYVVDADRSVNVRPVITTSSFGVTIDAPVAGWDAARVLPLFTVNNPDPAAHGPIASQSTFVIAEAPQAGEASPVASSLVVRLAAPDVAFGDSLYAANVARATVTLARIAGGRPPPGQGRKSGDPAKADGAPGRARHSVFDWFLRLLGLNRPGNAKQAGRNGTDGVQSASPAATPPLPPPAVLPNPPFRPIVSGIGVVIVASVTDAEGPGALSLRHVNQARRTDQQVAVSGAMLLPKVETCPSLEMSLAGARPGAKISLLLEISDPGKVSEARVCYWSGGIWRLLPNEAIRPAPVSALTRGGVLTFDVPADASSNGKDEALTLRIEFGASDIVPAFKAVTPNAFTATRITESSKPSVAAVPAGSIDARATHPAVAQIVQPLPSAGGRTAETAEDFMTRAADRLGHRGRGQTAWSLERLVLDHFDWVGRIKVLPVTPHRTAVAVVVASKDKQELDAGHRRAIADFLAARASSLARFLVVNAVFRNVDIDVSAVFAGSGEAGTPADPAKQLHSDLTTWLDSAPDLTDGASRDQDALCGSVSDYLLGLGYVREIPSLAIRVAPLPDSACWFAHTAGQINVTSLGGPDFAW